MNQSNIILHNMVTNTVGAQPVIAISKRYRQATADGGVTYFNENGTATTHKPFANTIQVQFTGANLVNSNG